MGLDIAAHFNWNLLILHESPELSGDLLIVVAESHSLEQAFNRELELMHKNRAGMRLRDLNQQVVGIPVALSESLKEYFGAVEQDDGASSIHAG